MEKHVIIDNEDSIEFHLNHKVTNVLDLHNGKELVTYLDLNNEDINLNISIAISASVTAFARVHMSQFKTMKNITLYYTDTDSIDIDKPLEDKFVGTELGKLKLEHVFEKAIFLAPKVYGGKTPNYEIVKVKGLKNTVSFNKLESLLNKENKLMVKYNQLKHMKVVFSLLTFYICDIWFFG